MPKTFLQKLKDFIISCFENNLIVEYFDILQPKVFTITQKLNNSMAYI